MPERYLYYMHQTVYFGDKPILLCDKLDQTISEYLHHSGTIFIDQVSLNSIKSLEHEMIKPDFFAAVIFDNDLQKLLQFFFEQFIVIQAAGGLVSNENGEILMIFRRGKWDLPKGKRDKGELISHCAIREVMEETGLADIHLGELITITYHAYNESGRHILKESHWYKMSAKSTEKLIPQLEEDINDIRWIGKNELQDYTSNTFMSILEVLDFAATKN